MTALLASPNGHSENGATPSIIPMNVLTESRFGIGRNQLNEALKVIPNAADRGKVEWFWKYCFERNLGRDDVARLLRKPNGKDFYSHDSVYAILTGKRFKEGATETVVRMLRAIEDFQQQVQPKAGQDGFIETRLFSEIREYVNRSRKLKRIGNIIGNMSVGKSESLLEIAERDPSVLYTQMPERGHYGDYLREVAEKCAISPRQNASTLRRNVVRALPEVLIVDDAHECFASMTSAWGLATLQFIKGSFDRKRKRLAVIFVWDTPGWAQFINGDHAHRLGRLWRRRMAPLRIDDVPYSDDLDLFAAAVGLDPAPAKSQKVDLLDAQGNVVAHHEDSPQRLQNDVCATNGIGVWKMILDDAAELARESRKTVTWGAVLKAHALFAAMEEKAAPAEQPASARGKR
jgi:hypothetical protein